jgi:predicted Zn-dependent protease
MQQGKMDEALHYFREALNLDTNYFEARFNLGSALLRLGETNEAAAQFNEILRQKPGFRPAEQMLARIQQNQSTNKP